MLPTVVGVSLRNLLGGFGDEAGLGDVRWSGAAMRPGVGEPSARLEALGDDLIGRLAVQHALAAGVVGGVEAAQQPLEVAVVGDQMVMPRAPRCRPGRPLKRSTMPSVWGD